MINDKINAICVNIFIINAIRDNEGVKINY